MSRSERPPARQRRRTGLGWLIVLLFVGLVVVAASNNSTTPSGVAVQSTPVSVRPTTQARPTALKKTPPPTPKPTTNPAALARYAARLNDSYICVVGNNGAPSCGGNGPNAAHVTPSTMGAGALVSFRTPTGKPFPRDSFSLCMAQGPTGGHNLVIIKCRTVHVAGGTSHVTYPLSEIFTAAHAVARDGMTYSVELDYDPWNTNRMEAMFSFTDAANSHQQPDPFQMASDEGGFGPTAECNDGTTSYSQHPRGTCSHHGGVAKWDDHLYHSTP